MNDVGQMTQYSDEAVVAGILEGAPALYEILIRRYNPYLYKIGRSYGYNHDDTEDLMQETYLNAYANLSKFEKRSTFKTWLVRIMMNQCNQKRQKKSFQYETASDILPEINTQPMFTDHRSETGSQVINKELGSIIERSVQSIPENYRRVFLLRELTGLSVQETADLLGISESNVKVRLNRAKSMLRTSIEKLYTPADIFEFNLVYCDRMVERVMGEIEKRGMKR